MTIKPPCPITQKSCDKPECNQACAFDDLERKSMSHTEQHTIIESGSQSKINIVMDMSQFDLFNLCEERYNNAHNLRLHRPGGKGKALDQGGVMHEGYEVYYKALQQGVKFDDALEACRIRIRSFASDPSNSSLEYEEVEGLVSVVTENLTYWREEDSTLEILAVEEPFAYVLYEDEEVRIIITGKIDLLVNKPGLGRGADYFNLPIDHKSYSRDGFLSPLSNQFQNYCVATGSNYLVVNRVGFQKSLKPHEKFKRLPLSYDELKLQAFKDNVTHVILRRYLDCVASGIWNMNFTSCDKFNRQCEFFEICDSSGEEAKQWKRENVYVVGEPWDVTKKLEGER